MATNAKNVSEDFDPAEWETAIEPFPETYDFEKNPILAGVFKSASVTRQVDKRTGEMRDVVVRTITSSGGKDWGVWDSWAIGKGFENIPLGTTVMIEFHGMQELDTGTVKKFTVRYRKS